MLHAFSYMMLAQLAVTPTMNRADRAEHDPLRHDDLGAEVFRRRARSRIRRTRCASSDVNDERSFACR